MSNLGNAIVVDAIVTSVPSDTGETKQFCKFDIASSKMISNTGCITIYTKEKIVLKKNAKVRVEGYLKRKNNSVFIDAISVKHF